MNREEITNVLPTLISRLEKAEDFVLEQTPIVVQELLAWNFTLSLTMFCLTLLIGPTVCYLFLGPIRRAEDRRDHDGGPMSFTAGVLGVVLTLLLLCGNLTWLKITIAPRVWLLEYASELVK